MAPAMTTMMAISDRLYWFPATSVAVMTASTALGPLTRARVPPHSAATIPTRTPHQSPASGPRPEMTPSAMAVGTKDAVRVMPALRSAEKIVAA